VTFGVNYGNHESRGSTNQCKKMNDRVGFVDNRSKGPDDIKIQGEK